MFGALHDAEGELWDDHQMVVQQGLDHLTELIVFFQSLDLGHLGQFLKGLPVQIVDKLDMWVGADNERQVLEITDAVSQAHGQLGADIVGGLEQLVFLHVAAKEDELAQSDGVDGLLDVRIKDAVLVKMLRRIPASLWTMVWSLDRSARVHAVDGRQCF